MWYMSLALPARPDSLSDVVYETIRDAIDSEIFRRYPNEQKVEAVARFNEGWYPSGERAAGQRRLECKTYTLIG